MVSGLLYQTKTKDRGRLQRNQKHKSMHKIICPGRGTKPQKRATETALAALFRFKCHKLGLDNKGPKARKARFFSKVLWLGIIRLKSFLGTISNRLSIKRGCYCTPMVGLMHRIRDIYCIDLCFCFCLCFCFAAMNTIKVRRGKFILLF